MSEAHYDAVIVGGGPAGATAAILLAQAGWAVALVERHRFPRRKVCGECIAASNLALFEALGVGEAFAALAGPPLQRVALLSGEDWISAPLPAARHAAQPWGRALGREQLDVLLLEQARALGVALWQPCSAQRLSGAPGAYECELLDAQGNASRLHAPVAIAANGAWEPLPAERAAQAAHRRDRDLLAFKANFAAAQLEPGLLPVLAFPGGYGGMVVADGGVLTLACCIQARALRVARQAAPGLRAGAAVLTYLQRCCRGVDAVLRGGVQRGEWLSVGPIRPGVHLPTRGPFRIGNAAGEAHPLVGEGISMAMQSAWLLCALLTGTPQARTRGPGALAVQLALHRRYAAQWRRQFLWRMRVANGLAQLAMRPRLLRALLPLLRQAPGLLTLSARFSGKVRGIRTARNWIAMSGAARHALAADAAAAQLSLPGGQKEFPS